MMNPTLITRRRLLIAMALSPLLWQMRGAQAADVDPQRVVALEWLPMHRKSTTENQLLGGADMVCCS